MVESNAQPRGNERNTGGAKHRFPFSFSHDSGDQPRTTVTRIPSSTFKPQINKRFLTENHDLSETSLERSFKRSSPFILPASPLDSGQRRRPDDHHKPRPMLSKPNISLKSEDKILLLGQGSKTEAPNAHIFNFPGRPPSTSPIDDELQPSTVNYSHQTLATKNFYLHSGSVPRLPEQGTNSGMKNNHGEPVFPSSASPRASRHFERTSSKNFAPPAEAEQPLRSRSRSKSLLVPYEEQQDISTLLMLGAAEARNCKAELAEQRREGAHLKTQLEMTIAQKAELELRLETAKATAKILLEAGNSKYEDLKSAFDSLHIQSQKSFAFVDEARNTMSSLKETREHALDTIKAIEPLLNENGAYSTAVQTKALVEELQTEYFHGQQVIDILRDKLYTVGGDLAEAKGRVSELEANQIREGNELNRLAANLLSSSVKMEDMMKLLAKREQESVAALHCAAEAESKLHSANEKMEHLTQALSNRDTRLEEMWHLDEDNVTLKSQLAEKISLIEGLESVKKDISAKLERATESFHEQELKTGILQEKTRIQDENISNLKQSLQKSDTQTEENRSTIRKLQEKLQGTTSSEFIALSKNEQSAEKIVALEGDLTQLKKAFAAGEEMTQQANKRYEVLQERFEDQSVTLRITKELNGDLQERLLSTETMYTGKFESNIGKLKLEIAVLQEQKLNLESSLDNLRKMAAEDARLHLQALSSTTAEYDKKLAQQETSSNRIIQAEERRATGLERDLGEAKNELLGAKKELGDARKTIAVLDERLAVVHADLKVVRERAREEQSATTQVEISGLTRRTKELECANADLISRADSINERYKKGDMSDKERELVNSLIQMSQSIHEQEVVSKANELRRRDNLIKTLQARIATLESTLARHLQAKARAEPGAEGRSMIDLNAWMSSSPLGAEALLPKTDAQVATSLPPAPQPRVVLAAQSAPTPTTSGPALTLPVNLVSGPMAPATVANEQEGRMTFTKLDLDETGDNADSGDDTPLSELAMGLGKRERTPSPMKMDQKDDVTRPSRRLKTVAQKPGSHAASGPNKASRTTRKKRR